MDSVALQFWSLLAGAFVLGAVIGSFLNVCIGRIPAGESIIHPPSRCPHCGSSIRWYQNIPILSYLFLAGRCASCKARISVRYPSVEALNGVLFAYVLWTFGMHWATPFYWVLVSALVVITFIDLDHQIIPDVISLPGVIIGLSLSVICPILFENPSYMGPLGEHIPPLWYESAIGILVGGGSLYLVAWLYELLAKKEGMGGGDIKLLAMLGAFMGWRAIFPVIFIASLLGTVVGVPLMLLNKKDGGFPIPFGPFLAAASLIYLFQGHRLIGWYLNLLS
ncbi:MAG: prepilin peptidase [Desulfuromonadales bacterium]